LEHKTSQPDFWSDQKEAQRILSELSSLKKKLEDLEELESMAKDLEVLKELASEDPEFSREFDETLKKFEKKLADFEVKLLLDEPEDAGNAILEIHPGAGGTESHDWAEMLMRMYLRWMERKGFKYEILDLLPGEEAGIKSVSILVKGPYAYGLLKNEIGVHRLVIPLRCLPQEAHLVRFRLRVSGEGRGSG